MRRKGNARPPKRSRKTKKPAPPGSMQAEVPRKLTEREIDERSRRLARKTVELAALERQKKADNRKVNGDIKECRAEVDKLAEEIVHGEEMVKQGDLFAPPKEDGKLPPDGASRALAGVGQRAGEESPATPVQ